MDSSQKIVALSQENLFTYTTVTRVPDRRIFLLFLQEIIFHNSRQYQHDFYKSPTLFMDVHVFAANYIPVGFLRCVNLHIYINKYISIYLIDKKKRLTPNYLRLLFNCEKVL